MAQTVPSEGDLPAQVAALAAEMDALHRGLIETGVIASTALARVTAIGDGLAAAYHAAGIDCDLPVMSRAEARRQRIVRSGFRLVQGGAS